MRKDWSHLEKFRVRKGPVASSSPGDDFGFFVVQDGPRRQIRMMASSGLGWEHVSVSIKYRSEKGKVADAMPTWGDMCRVKELFWEDEEAVYQIHPPRSEYVNTCANCLHLWRPVDGQFPRPDKALV